TLWPSFELRTPGRLAERSSGSGKGTGEDALLLLWTAVRDPVEGSRQPGYRFRAVGRLPIQSRHAVSKGRQAIHAEQSSGSALVSADARSVRLPKCRME